MNCCNAFRDVGQKKSPTSITILVIFFFSSFFFIWTGFQKFSNKSPIQRVLAEAGEARRSVSAMQQLAECSVCGNGLGPKLGQVPGVLTRTAAEKVQATGVTQACCRVLIQTYNIKAPRQTVYLEHRLRLLLFQRQQPPLSAQLLACVR